MAVLLLPLLFTVVSARCLLLVCRRLSSLVVMALLVVYDNLLETLPLVHLLLPEVVR